MGKRDGVIAKNRKKFATIITITVCIVLLFTTVILTYLQGFSGALERENGEYLSEITDHIAINTEIIVDGMLRNMEIAGLMISNMAGVSKNRIYLNGIKEKEDFEYVSFADKQGNATSTLESEERNIAEEDYFKSAIGGDSTVKYIPIKIFRDKVISGLIVATPVYDLSAESKNQTGILLSMLDIKKLSDDLHMGGFNGQGVTYIIDNKGEIVLSTKQMDYSNLYVALANVDFTEGYSVDTIEKNLSKHEEGFAIYSNFGVEKYMQYQFIGIDNWSVVSVIEKNIIAEKTTKITKQLMGIGIAIMIIFPLLLVFAISSLEISKSSRQAANAKTAFLANMSHEIRTPMNAIVGISEILLRENISSKQKDYVLSIVNAGNGLLTIINDILDISKIESGKFSITEEEYELESIIFDVVTIAAIKIEEKPIDLMLDVDMDLPKYIIGDMTRVKQVLLNIIGNAIKFTKSGYVKIGIYAENEDGKLHFVMPIEDTGIGIKKEDLKELFISFNQVDTHKNSSLEGTGLGLVISKRLCEMMGGDIDVESEYERGSTFTIRLNQRVERPEKMMRTHSGEHFNILLLESSDSLRTHFKNCMRRMDLNFDACETYDDFMKKLITGEYTHVILRQQILRKIVEEEHKMEKTIFIALLEPKEQSAMGDFRFSIIVPLFTMQLSSILYNRGQATHLLKQGGIETTSIQPMPFIKILIVDDNEVNLQVANGLMIPYHMQVDCVLSGAKAIAAVVANDYDLVFMDHMMPEMDGVEAVKIIRGLEDERKNSVPIVALTANVTQDARSLFMESGFNDFISKPIETVRLNELLRKWLREKNDIRAKKNTELAEQFRQNIVMQDKKSKVNIVGYSKSLAKSSYINFSEGIEQLGDCQVYCNILETYCRSAKEKIHDLPLLLEKDLSSFVIEIHGLKGASGGVSAEFIAKEAFELEQLAKDNRVDEIREKLPEFLKALSLTLMEIDNFISDNIKQNQPENFIRGERILANLTAVELSAMKEAFLNFDTEKLKTIFEDKEGFSYNEEETMFLAKLKEYYNAYNFDDPLELIEKYEQSKNWRTTE